MATYEQVNYEDVEPVSGAMHSLSDSLDSQQADVSTVRCDPDWRSKPHDHSENDHEEIYILLDGRATVVVDDEEVEIAAGNAVWEFRRRRPGRYGTERPRARSSSSAHPPRAAGRARVPTTNRGPPTAS